MCENNIRANMSYVKGKYLYVYTMLIRRNFVNVRVVDRKIN